MTRFIEKVVASAQIASLLEVSGWPKPGNVHRTADLPETRFEHFLVGSVAIGPATRKAAIRGIKVGKGMINVSEIKVGNLIKQAVKDVQSWHHGGNTHLGISMIFIPLASSAGKTYAETGYLSVDRLRKNFDIIMKETTPLDSVEVYEAISIAMEKDRLGKVRSEEAPDVFDKHAKDKLISRGISFYECMKISSKYDRLAEELSNGLKITFEKAYPTLMKIFEETRDINIATVHTFLTILSNFPDTFIARKLGLKETPYIEDAIEIGMEKARWISERAKSILEIGGLLTDEGRRELMDFDRILQASKGELNPGTTADITAASLFIAILLGLRF